MQFPQGRVHLLLVVPAFFCQTDVPAHFFKEPDAAQFILQVMDSAGEGGLGDAQPGSGKGIMLQLGQNGKIPQIVIVHKDGPPWIYRYKL